MSTKTHSILVIEDERPLLNAIKTKLEINHFDAVSARSVEQALGYCKDGVEIDAVWLDHYLLGRETGLDFVAKMKEEQSLKNIPIFVVSNTGSPDKKHIYMRLGATKYFVKSDHRLDSIIEEIKNYLENPDE